MRTVLLLLTLLLAAPASAQSGHGGIEGLVVPFDTSTVRGYGAGGWRDDGGAGLEPGAVAEASPTLTLIPLVAHLDPDTLTTRAAGNHGAFEFSHVPMGSYRLRVTAPGFEPWELEVYLPSDYLMRLSVLLRPQRED